MAQWGKNDQAVTANSTTTVESTTGAPIGTYTAVKGDQVNRGGSANAHFGNTSSGSRASTDASMFGNVTMGAFMANVAVGVFGVDTTEASITTGNLAATYVTSGGTGYGANAVVTLTLAAGTTNATAINAYANSTTSAGRITVLNITAPGSTYATAPSLAIAAPSNINITANSTGFSNSTNVLVVATANSKWQVGDRLYYGVPSSNTPISPLTGNTYYYVSFANTTTVALSATSGGANVDIVDTRTTNPGETHTITGDTATGYVIINGGKNVGITHAGWVIRREGQGGRAGRIQYETLVAMSSIATDASDDNTLPE